MDIMEVMEDEATWWPMPRFSAKHEGRRGQVVIGAEEIKKIVDGQTVDPNNEADDRIHVW